VGEDASSLARIGFAPFFEAQLAKLDGGREPARIAIAHGESYVVWTRHGVRKGVLPGRRLATWKTAAERPQVGDWVTGTASHEAGALLIEHLLERRTCLVRRAAGERAEAQVIAANVDVVGVVSAFGDGQDAERDRRLINENRLRRYLSAVAQSGARAVLIVNKGDLNPDAEAVVATLGGFFPGVPVAVMSGRQGLGLERLRPWLGPGQTLALVGMSGVGKSTLVNALLGRAAQQVGDVRESDARGRHTTTHRELFLTEGGALLIDTPGMRELGLWDVDEVVAFDDVVVLAAGCRFTNCRHATEPGCAIVAALASGALAPERWQSYRSQQEKLHGPADRSRSVFGPPGGARGRRRR
jgi:ribosome biogenesis GTPase